MESELCSAIVLKAELMSDACERYHYLRSTLDTCISAIKCEEFNTAYSLCCLIDSNQDEDLLTLSNCDFADQDDVELGILINRSHEYMESKEFHASYVRLFDLFTSTVKECNSGY